ncbi:MAG TPA: PT domain-containing protein [Brevibacterium senegalense]|uniref:PT domain-containing protein n=1 Tax=Brevibacterium senegalense TaxID=1033736 RepID=A0A921SND6_9MICO|nr:PT domain-containing protein [Brevibacterium senegalense]
MKKNSLSSRALAPAVVLAVGALVATPALAQVDADAAGATNASTATPEATTTEPSETASDAPADEATDQTESGKESDSGEQAEAPQTTQPAEEETTESTPDATEEASPEATEDPSQISPTVRMDYPLPAQTVHDDGIEVRVKTAPNAPVDITKASVSFTGGYTLQLPDEWDGTADDNGDYVFTIAPDTPITTTFKPEERNTTVGQLSDGDRITVQVRTNGKNTSFTTAVEGTAQEAKPTVTFPDHPDNAATRTIGEDFTARVAYTGATEGDPVTVIVNGYTQKHGNGNYEAPATVTETDGEFEVTLPASFLDEVHSGTADDQDVLQVRVGSTRNHVRITEEEAPAKPTVTFPNNPDGTAERKAGESISVKVRYDDVKTGDPISVVANGEVLTHGEGYQSIQKTDYVRGGFFVRLDGEFLDGTRADGEPERDTVEVRVGEGSATLDILEIADEPTEEPTDDPTEDPTEDPTDDPTEDPEEISPTVRMDYPLPAQTVHDEGIEVRVKTAPNAPVDVTRTSVLFTGGYTLELPDEWDGTADENGDYVFTIAPDTPITSDFRPERNTTVGQLSDGDGVVVQIRSNGKSTSFATEVEGTAVEPTEDPTEEPTEDPTDEPTEEPTEDPTDDPTDDGDDDQGDDDQGEDDGQDGDQGDELALSIAPERITASEFVDSERGVVLTVKGLEPGDDVEFAVAPTSGQNVDPADLPATATEDGVASTVVYGTTTIDPASYIGDYSVAVSGIDEDDAQAGSETAGTEASAASADDLTGTFTVTSDDGSGDGGSDDGSDDDGSSDGGSDGDADGGSDSEGDSKDDGQLPRTGADLGGLAVGAALLAVGGAAVVISRRRFNHGA